MIEPQPHEIHQVEISKEARKQTNFLGTVKIKPGHKFWKYDGVKITEVTDEDYEDVVTDLSGNPKQKLIVEDGCIYTSALNKKNAVKRWYKEGFLSLE